MKDNNFIEGIVIPYIRDAEDLFSFRMVCRKWKEWCEELLVERYLTSFGAEQAFVLLIKILLIAQSDSFLNSSKEVKCASSVSIPDYSKRDSQCSIIARYQFSDIPINYLKLFALSEKRQEILKEKVKKKTNDFYSKKVKSGIVREVSQFKEEWIIFLQIIAGIAALNSENFNFLLKEFPHVQVLALLNAQQEIKLSKILFGAVVRDQRVSLSYSRIDLKVVILIAIKTCANRLLEFLLRMGAGNWYDDKPLLMEQEGKGWQNQHPMVTCCDYNNTHAFQLFLTHANHLLSVYHYFSSLSYPPLYWVAYEQKLIFIEMVAKQKPEVLSLRDTLGRNVAHGLLQNTSRDRDWYSTICLLQEVNPGLFSVEGSIDGVDKTPQQMLDESGRYNYRYHF
jgi:hypothetical protein